MFDDLVLPHAGLLDSRSPITLIFILDYLQIELTN